MSYLLIIDDDKDTRQILADICQYMGHEVAVASNGLEGIELAKTRIPDLIILDLMMPEMNGLQFLSKLRSNPATSKVPVVILSAISADQMQGLPGVTHVFHKSHMNVSQLRESISEVLGQEYVPNNDVVSSSAV